jgi:hypothetical protein
MACRARILTAAAIGSAIALILAACEDPTPPNPQSPDDFVNPATPNANDLIVSQTIAGDSTKASSIYDLIEAGDTGFYFRGTSNGQIVVGKLDENGVPVWTANVTGARGVCRVPATSGPIANALLVVGLNNVAQDLNEAKVLVYGAGGALLSTTTYLHNDRSVWFNQAVCAGVQGNQRDFIAVGNFAHLEPWPHHPYAARFALLDDGSVVKGKEAFYDSVEGNSFNGVAANDTPGSHQYFAAGHLNVDASTTENLFIASLSDSLEVSWSAHVAPPDGSKPETSMGPIGYAEGRAFVVATMEVQKNPPPSTGGSWHAGVLTGLTPGGQVEWTRTVSLTNNDDKLLGAVGGAGSLIAVGNCAAYQLTPSARHFGYGLLVEFAAATGNPTTPLSFGNRRYGSGFNMVVLRGRRAFAAGWTNYRVSGGGFQSWFVEIDLSNPPLQRSALVPTTDASAAVPDTGPDRLGRRR